MNLHLTLRMAPAVCAAALFAAGIQAAGLSASNTAPPANQHRVIPPAKPTVVTEIVPVIPEEVRMTTEQGKGKPRGFDTRRHRLPNGNYKRD